MSKNTLRNLIAKLSKEQQFHVYLLIKFAQQSNNMRKSAKN